MLNDAPADWAREDFVPRLRVGDKERLLGTLSEGPLQKDVLGLAA